MEENGVTLMDIKAGPDFVETPYVKGIIGRALHYLHAGFPVHFRGISGTGKTTLALRIAELLARPTVLLHGDEQLTTADLVGNETGYHMRRVRDNFIASVLKIEEDSSRRWVDNRLTVAVKGGYTLIYDEFTRSQPEANNVLLAVLQEGILDIPSNRAGEEDSVMRTHPDFRAIFTSNPEEYAGVHRSQDALRDRMVTLDIEPPDEETETLITNRKSGLEQGDAKKIVKVVRQLRANGQLEFAPTIRGCIMIAKTVKDYGHGIHVKATDPTFTSICLDVLTSETSRSGSKTNSAKVRGIIKKAISRHCHNGRH